LQDVKLRYYTSMSHNNKGLILLALPPDFIPPGAKDRILGAADGRDLRVSISAAEIEGFLDAIEIGFGDVPFSLIPRMPRLRWVQLWSAGADWLQQYPQVKSLPFTLTNTSGMHGQQITEHIFGLIFAWNRRFVPAFAAQGRHEWRRPASKTLDSLAGKTMLIAGYGAIGVRTAQAALAFGMEVIGVRRSPPAPEEQGAVPGLTLAAAGDLPALLPRADLVVNILPLTQDTRHFFGEVQFGLMKPSALYVNVGRGPTTDEAALVRALRDRGIAGALLDVTEKEPLPPDSPLWDMENVILTAHYAGFHRDYDTIALEIALDNLGRYIRGEALRYVVDKEAGY
jgi:phosphoglycerate dehydrogenase-like enzyme